MIDLSQLISLFMLLIAALGLGFGFMRWREGIIHGRIEKVKEGVDRDLKDIRDNYIHKDVFSTAITSIKQTCETIQSDVKMLIGLQIKKNKDDE